MKKRIALLLIAVLLTATGAAPVVQQRVVAIGDVHGGFEDFITILQTAEIIDAQNNWAGGKTTFIQTGDILDRGIKSRAVMDLLILLERQAPRKGGRVLPLLGNHEMMNMMGDLRYVPAEEYANYAGSGSEKRREAGYQAYVEFRKRRAKALKQPEPVITTEQKNQWEETHPLGFLEHRDAFGPAGTYGRWVRKHDAIAEVESIIFLHGGISPAISNLSVKQINQRIKDETRLFDSYKSKLTDQGVILPFFTLEEMTAAAKEELEFRQKVGPKNVKLLQDVLAIGSWLSINKDGPLWFRGYAEWSGEEGAPQTENLLKTYGVKHFVVGHTVQQDGSIRSRFNNGVFLIDTGMLRSYVPNGQASALEIQDGKFTAIYKNRRVALFSSS